MLTTGSDSSSKPANSAEASRGGDAARPSEALVGALRKMLRPLVRLLLSNQITYPFLGELLKQVYVEAADEDFALEGRRQTVTRVSLLTGIHRKDIKRLRETRQRVQEPVAKGVSLGALLVSTWTGDKTFLDTSGEPLALPRLTRDDLQPSFESLVASVSKDIHPRAILDEWLRLGVVELDAEGSVRLVVEAFVPDRGFEEKAYYLGENLRDHVAAAAHNLSGRKPAQLERRVHYDALSSESVRELAELSEELGMQALQAVNRRARELKERDRAGQEEQAGQSSQSGEERMSFGIYFHRAPFPSKENDTSD